VHRPFRSALRGLEGAVQKLPQVGSRIAVFKREVEVVANTRASDISQRLVRSHRLVHVLHERQSYPRSFHQLAKDAARVRVNRCWDRILRNHAQACPYRYLGRISDRVVERNTLQLSVTHATQILSTGSVEQKDVAFALLHTGIRFHLGSRGQCIIVVSDIGGRVVLVGKILGLIVHAHQLAHRVGVEMFSQIFCHISLCNLAVYINSVAPMHKHVVKPRTESGTEWIVNRSAGCGGSNMVNLGIV